MQKCAFVATQAQELCDLIVGQNTALIRFCSLLNETCQIPFESSNWFLGTVEDNQGKSYTALATYFRDSNQMCKTVVIDVVDPANADGYLEVRHIFLGRTVEPHMTCFLF